VISNPKRKSAAAGVVQIMVISLSAHLPGDSCKNVQFVSRRMPTRSRSAQPDNHDFALMIFMKRHGSPGCTVSGWCYTSASKTRSPFKSV
jgi:hypothetical protein